MASIYERLRGGERLTDAEVVAGLWDFRPLAEARRDELAGPYASVAEAEAALRAAGFGEGGRYSPVLRGAWYDLAGWRGARVVALHHPTERLPPYPDGIAGNHRTLGYAVEIRPVCIDRETVERVHAAQAAE